MATTDHLSLYLPTREDYISVLRDLSQNFEKIDESAEMTETGMAIVVDGDEAPRNITSGQYLFVKNSTTLSTGGYHATANISSGAAVDTTNTAPDTDGIANAIHDQIGKISDLTTSVKTSIVAAINSADNNAKGRARVVNLRYGKTITVGQADFSLGILVDGGGGLRIIQTGGSSAIVNIFAITNGALTFTITRSNHLTAITASSDTNLTYYFVEEAY